MTAVLDVDGTLIDSNYQHAVAWGRAMARFGVEVPLWRVHRRIGMGGDKLVGAVAGEQVEAHLGDQIREAEGALFGELIGEVRPIAGSRELIEELKASGDTVILASSAKSDEVEHYLSLLDSRDLVDGWTTAADVEATKPAPDLIEVALEKFANSGEGLGQAVMLGDTVWDAKAAGEVGIPMVGVATGGICNAELIAAGAACVVDSAREAASALRRVAESVAQASG